MNQRSVDPEVQAVRLVRRRPMSTSNSAPQTAMRWVNADCALIRKSNQFFLKVTERNIASFVSCPGTELGFRLLKSRNTIRVMMMMTMMILIIDSLHVSGCSVQHCGLSIKSPWTQLKQLTAPSQDFCGYKRCRYHSLFSFCDWLRIWRRLNCSPLKSLTCSCIDFSLYNRPWRRGFGKSVWGMENA